jgi:hypothetical protein
MYNTFMFTWLFFTGHKGAGQEKTKEKDTRMQINANNVSANQNQLLPTHIIDSPRLKCYIP